MVAKDTPSFIGNRIGLHGVMRALHLIAEGEFTIEEVDAISGPIIGRPKSATCRTMDIAGLDVLAHVAGDLGVRLDREDERAEFSLPPLVQNLVERGWVGEKAGQGLYKKERGPEGTRILTLEPSTMEYRERQAARLPSLEAAGAIDDLRERIRTLFLGQDRAGAFLRATLGRTLLYAAEVAPRIAHSIDDVDRAMQWGFGWELGPFEIWDAIGVDAVLEACQVSDAPSLVRDLGASRRFREDDAVAPAQPDLQLLRLCKARHAPVKQNAGASLIDLGDDVLAVEFHSKMNAIGGDTVEMLRAGVDEAPAQASRPWWSGNDAVNFSAGANLLLVLLEAQEENWDEIDLMVRAFQSAVMGLRYAEVPVVVAPAGLTLGGGCEITLHGDRVQAAAETYHRTGGGRRGSHSRPAAAPRSSSIRAIERQPAGVQDALPYVRPVFELIGYGTVSASGPDAKRLGLMRDLDRVTMNRERLMSDAKNLVTGPGPDGLPATDARAPRVPVGGADLRAGLELGVHLMWRGGFISDHDARVGRALARVLAGGDLPHASTVSEQHLLDLEREAFLSLCGEPKTQERIAHTLKTGKTLRN